jgi:hypothetical protein
VKTRRHHNNKGTRQIKRGKTAAQVERMARRLGVPFAVGECPEAEEMHEQNFRRIIANIKNTK